MQIAFTGGTSLQRSAIRSAVAAIKSRHLDLDLFDFTWEVSFVPDPDPTQAHEFAITNGVASEFRSDFPFGPGSKYYPTYAGTEFLVETAAHELAHALLNYAGNRADTIARYFGLPFQGASGWNDPQDPWNRRYVEAAAETFKDIFLPQTMRKFSNRTLIEVPIVDYAKLRKRWRKIGAGVTSFIADEFESADNSTPYDNPDWLGGAPTTIDGSSRWRDLIASQGNNYQGFGTGTMVREDGAVWMETHELAADIPILASFFSAGAPRVLIVSLSGDFEGSYVPDFIGAWELTTTDVPPGSLREDNVFGGAVANAVTYSGLFPVADMDRYDAGGGLYWWVAGDARPYGPPDTVIPWRETLHKGSVETHSTLYDFGMGLDGAADPSEFQAIADSIPILSVHDPAGPVVPQGLVVPSDIQAGTIAHRTVVGGSGG